jgi:hypothetical protein
LKKFERARAVCTAAGTRTEPLVDAFTLDIGLLRDKGCCRQSFAVQPSKLAILAIVAYLANSSAIF